MFLFLCRYNLHISPKHLDFLTTCSVQVVKKLLFRKELTAAECACVNMSGQYGAVHNGQLVGCIFWGGVFLLICVLSV